MQHLTPPPKYLRWCREVCSVQHRYQGEGIHQLGQQLIQVDYLLVHHRLHCLLCFDQGCVPRHSHLDGVGRYSMAEGLRLRELALSNVWECCTRRAQISCTSLNILSCSIRMFCELHGFFPSMSHPLQVLLDAELVALLNIIFMFRLIHVGKQLDSCTSRPFQLLADLFRSSLAHGVSRHCQ